MTKCNLCSDYIDEGKNPSCVDACPMRAMDFGEFDELIKIHGNPDDVYPLPNRHHTEPSIVVNPHRSSDQVELEKPEVANLEEVRNA